MRSSFDIAAFLDRKYKVQEMEAQARMIDARSGERFRGAQGGLVQAQTAVLPETARINNAQTSALTEGQRLTNLGIPGMTTAQIRGLNAASAGREGANKWIDAATSAQVNLDYANAANVGANTLMTGLTGSKLLRDDRPEAEFGDPTISSGLGLESFLNSSTNPFRSMFGGGLTSGSKGRGRRRTSSLFGPPL
jgi:hypothetical protein